MRTVRSTPRIYRPRVVRVLAAAGLALAVGVVGLTATTEAATPTQGTVSPTATSVSWTGGPFVAPNATGTAGTPTCTVPSSCDDFALHVRTPAGYSDGHRLRIQVSWTNTAADFDVYLLDAAGAVVATAASSADPETVLTAPTTGDYKVRVVPYAPLGSSFTAKAGLTTVAAPPAPGTEPRPGFANYRAPSSFTDSNNAGEPSIGTNFTTGATTYQAYLST